MHLTGSWILGRYSFQSSERGDVQVLPSSTEKNSVLQTRKRQVCQELYSLPWSSCTGPTPRCAIRFGTSDRWRGIPSKRPQATLFWWRHRKPGQWHLEKVALVWVTLQLKIRKTASCKLRMFGKPEVIAGTCWRYDVKIELSTLTTFSWFISHKNSISGTWLVGWHVPLNASEQCIAQFS